MPLPVPVLDDLDWSELVEEARDRLPALAPRWTDHNVHDPGITIIELLAWVSEVLCFRIDQIPEGHRLRFLALLGLARQDTDTVDDVLVRGARTLWAHERLAGVITRAGAVSLDELDRAVVDALDIPARAVTCWDLERVAVATPGVDVARVRAWPNLDLSLPCALAPGTVSLVVVPPEPDDRPELTSADRATVTAHVDRLRTVGTQVRVFGPRYTPVAVSAAVTLQPTADPDRTLAAARDAVTGFLHPLRGGPDGTGWPFGRDVYQSELMAVIGSTDGVDLPATVTVRTTDERSFGAAGARRCANACVPAANLPILTSVEITVAPDGDGPFPSVGQATCGRLGRG